MHFGCFATPREELLLDPVRIERYPWSKLVNAIFHQVDVSKVEQTAQQSHGYSFVAAEDGNGVRDLGAEGLCGHVEKVWSYCEGHANTDLVGAVDAGDGSTPGRFRDLRVPEDAQRVDHISSERSTSSGCCAAQEIGGSVPARRAMAPTVPSTCGNAMEYTSYRGILRTASNCTGDRFSGCPAPPVQYRVFTTLGTGDTHAPDDVTNPRPRSCDTSS